MIKKTAAAAVLLILAACGSNANEESYLPIYESVNPENWPEVVATVNGEDIHKDQIEMDFVDYTQSYEQAASGSEEEQLIVQERILTQLLKSEIDSVLLLQSAKEKELNVTDEELEQTIDDLRLQENIETDEQYEETVQAGGTSVEEFEDRVKEDLIRFKLLDAYQGTPNISEEKIKEVFESTYEDQDVNLEDVRQSIEAELVAEYRQIGAAELIETLHEDASINIMIERN